MLLQAIDRPGQSMFSGPCSPTPASTGPYRVTATIEQYWWPSLHGSEGHMMSSCRLEFKQGCITVAIIKYQNLPQSKAGRISIVSGFRWGYLDRDGLQCSRFHESWKLLFGHETINSTPRNERLQNAGWSCYWTPYRSQALATGSCQCT